MSGDNATASEWREVGRTDFGRLFDRGYTCVLAIAERHEGSGEIRLRVEVPNAQIFALPRDMVPLIQVMGWAIACLAYEHNVITPDAVPTFGSKDFAIWEGCCNILNSLDPLVIHAKSDV